MTPLAFVLILASAGLHATWNMIAKKQGASLAFYAILGTVGLAWSSFFRLYSPLHFVGQPPAFYAWLVGMLLSELTYARGLHLSYTSLDMSTAYPMMRSIPLILLAVITAVFGFGKPLGPHALFGLAMVFAGCLVIPLRRFSDFSPALFLDRNFLYVILVALGTTGYTLCDSQAQRVMLAAAPDVSKPIVSITYYAFRAMTLTTLLWIVVLAGRHTRMEALDIWRRRSWMPLVAGACSSLTYVLVLVAMNFVTNVSYVQAFRQIGLLFGLLEGVFILHERCTAPKVVGLALILGGLAVSVL
ncbi:MAG: hypothetical protein ILM98_10295 [Kiritimatiellae bacterium]|nr:hypothetical protein [Kiritimatiellia bacterium]